MTVLLTTKTMQQDGCGGTYSSSLSSLPHYPGKVCVSKVTHFYVIMPSIQSLPLFPSINMTAQLSGCSQCLEVEEMIQKQTNKQN